MHKQELLHLIAQFDTGALPLDLAPYGSGHIHDTWVAIYPGGKRFVHQRLNTNVFPDVAVLMRNLFTVTSHLRAKGEPTLTPVPARSGAPTVRDPEGREWRSFEFIEGSRSFETCEGPAHAFEAGRIMGRFERRLADLDPRGLGDALPGYLDVPGRFTALSTAISADRAGRVSGASEEIDFALANEGLASFVQSALDGGEIPRRVTHNDMKLNNVLFDSRGEKALVLLDLDTCMSGSPLFDFGDLARNVSLRVAEDELDLSKVAVERPMLEGALNGYLKDAAGMLTEAEKELLPGAPMLMALSLGVRFLTDHLNGDTYFKIARPGHNLDRARTQLEITRKLEEERSFLARIIKEG